MVKLRSSYKGTDCLQPMSSFIQFIKEKELILKQGVNYKRKDMMDKDVKDGQIKTYSFILKFANSVDSIECVQDFINNRLDDIPELEKCSPYQMGMNMAYQTAFHKCEAIVQDIRYEEL